MIALLLAAAVVVSPAVDAPDFGIAEGRCRTRETGPAVIVTAVGLKDRKGTLRLELFPANDQDFLADDRDLVRDGKTFRRAVIAVPPEGDAELCVRVPYAGVYAMSLVHDRDNIKKFKLSIDGIGFSGNPRLGLSKPHADAARIEAGAGLTRVSIRLNYRRGLFSFGPLRDTR